MNYVALDLENPNTRGNSICSLGLVFVRNGQIVDRSYSLINPEDRFDRNNSRITGLSESMVRSAPTLPEYWVQLQDLVKDQPIVGHNVRYDLNVLSKSLERYSLPVPQFHYICTLELSRKLLTADSYSLNALTNQIGYRYAAHHALADAEASHVLLQYLIGTYRLVNLHAQPFTRAAVSEDKLDQKLLSHINDLFGIIQGIASDGVVDQVEVGYLRQWLDDNAKYKVYGLFARLLNELEVILADGIVTEYERQELLTLTNHSCSSRLYSEATLGIQILEGLLKGIVCNQLINEAEILNLQQWLLDHDYLSGVYPYDKIIRVVRQTLDDGRLTPEETTLLMHEFDEVLHPVKPSPGVNLRGHTFCLTGDFSCGSRSEVEALLIQQGGIKKSGVSSKLDYLFVGGLGSEAWAYGNLGGKIARAQELQEKGCPVQIISEADLSQQLLLPGQSHR
ncbi:hypothetical protein HCH52_01065 [Oscillospiraceae bacterium HV4-5-C5C]|nr:hypothetical protein [Oscillospiraceae bacterium HV4-5-C5C]